MRSCERWRGAQGSDRARSGKEARIIVLSSPDHGDGHGVTEERLLRRGLECFGGMPTRGRRDSSKPGGIAAKLAVSWGGG